MTPELPKPTDAELTILRSLWRRGEATVRDVVEDLNQTQPTGYTTVLKLLQIMLEKGLVTRQEAERAHVYTPARTEEQIQGQLLRHLLDKAFDGSASLLVQRALAAAPTAPEELSKIRRLLRGLERRTE